MKKINTVIIGLALLAGITSYAQIVSPTLQTYTNGYHVRVPVSDQTWKSLQVVRMLNNATNIPIGQYVASNRTVLIGAIAPEANRQLSARRAALMQKIQTADDAQLLRYEAVQ